MHRAAARRENGFFHNFDVYSLVYFLRLKHKDRKKIFIFVSLRIKIRG